MGSGRASGYHLENGRENMTDIDLLYKRLRDFGATGKPRSPRWLTAIRILPCVKCGSIVTEAHHIFGSYGSLKTSDIFTVPVCRECHEVIEKPQHRELVIESWCKIAHRFILETMERDVPVINRITEIPGMVCGRCGSRFGMGMYHNCTGGK